MLLMLLVFSGCQTFKDTGLGHFYHNVTARYNGYFNAKERMKAVEDQLFVKHPDNYNKILDVFPIGDESLAKSFQTDLETVSKKCSRVIKRHDVSHWIDDCYLLIGKANYFKRDYYTAIETFQYVNLKYPGTEPGQEAPLWIVRCYLAMNKLNDAQAQISSLRTIKFMPDKLKKHFDLIQADFYIKNGENKLAIPFLERVVAVEKKKKYKVRYMFILAQLYQDAEQKDKAAVFFKEVIKKNPPYDLAFQSKIGLAEVSSNYKENQKYLSLMTRDEKNLSYLDQIYYVLAKNEMRQGNQDEALKYLQLSTRSSAGNNNQKAMSYLMEADILFNRQVYPPAKMYYDSAANFIDKTYPNFEKFKERQKLLGDLVTNLITVQREDSLQRISKMPKDEMDRFIQKVADLDRQKALEQSRQNNQNSQNNQYNPNFNMGDQMGIPGLNSGQLPQFQMGQTVNKNPLTDPAAIALGAADFQRIWGNRKLEDNWRRKEKPVNNLNTGNILDTPLTSQSHGADTFSNEGKKLTFGDRPAALQKYYQSIPFTAAQVNQSNSQIQDALFAIGNIYYRRLEDENKAREAYESLLERFPDTKYNLQACYNLYLIYKDRKNIAKADSFKNIIMQTPGNPYAELITHPEKTAEKFMKRNQDEALEKLYADAFTAFSLNNCAGIQSSAKEANRQFAKNYLKAKFDYLRVLCYGKGDTTDRFIDTLNAFTKRYPGDEVSRQALDLIKILKERKVKPNVPIVVAPQADTSKNSPPKVIKVVSYSKNTEGGHAYVVVFPSAANASIVTTSFANFNSDNFSALNLDISSFLLDDNWQLVVIKGFPSGKDAMNYFTAISRKPRFFEDNLLKDHQEFVISDENFKLFFKNRDVEGYMKFFKENYQ